MYNIIPLFIILVSLFVILVIITRKFSVLASLDLDTIQAEKEARFKEQIISNRLKRNIVRYNSKAVKALKPLGNTMAGFGKGLIDKLTEFKENYNKEESDSAGPKDVAGLNKQADELIKEERLDEAEKIYIEIISLDSQNLEAFKGLGKLYSEKKQFREAKQTFEHALRLVERDMLKTEEGRTEERVKNDERYTASIYFELAKACKANEEMGDSLANIKKATKIEPGNPRFLDMKIDISIINKDKAEALDALQKLKEVNPENKKLEEFEIKIKEL